MERNSSARRVSLLQFATIVAILALVMMHTPAISQAMPAGHGTRATMSTSHMNGSACSTVHDQAVTAPAVPEQNKLSPVVSADAPTQFNDLAFHPLDQTTLSIWRT